MPNIYDPSNASAVPPWSAFTGLPSDTNAVINQYNVNIEIAGSFADITEFNSNTPDGRFNVGYIVGDHLFVWDGTNWVDAGPFVGPEGPAGPAGVQNIIVSPEQPPAPLNNEVVWIWLDTSVGGQ